MTNKAKILSALGVVAFAAAAGIAIAQTSSLIPAALADGVVGEQADGYLGIRGQATGTLKSEVDALNIKRRAAYTALAEQRGVTIKDVAVATGCETLAKRVAPGRAYMLADGVWRVRGAAPITPPAYCAS
jgi:uncharacterized protein